MMASRSARSASRHESSTRRKSARKLTDSAYTSRMPSTACSGVSSAMRPACTSSSCCCRSAMRRCRCSARLCGSGLSAAARLSISRCTTARRDAVEVIIRPSSCAMKRSAVLSASVSNTRPSRSTTSPRRIHSRTSRRAWPRGSSLSISKSTSLACAANMSASACTAASNGTPSRWCSNNASRQLNARGARREASNTQAGCCWRAAMYLWVRCWLRVGMVRFRAGTSSTHASSAVSGTASTWGAKAYR